MRGLAALLALLAAAGAAWLAVGVLFEGQSVDEAHLAAKRRYLSEIEQSAGSRVPAPSVVFFLFDDLGYGDLGTYGGRAIRTPSLDRLAAEGVRFTQAYAPSPYCTASRAGFLTGRYAVRSGLDHVLAPSGTWPDLAMRLGRLNRRLPKEEITLAEVLSAAGYATAAFGKWHLGGESPSLPTERGFDRFYGLLYSNDQGRPVVYEGEEVVERHPIDQSSLTRRYTERALEFVAARCGRPFFLYLPHTFPHIPLHVGADALGASPAGLYGDVVEELDRSVGEVMGAVESCGADVLTFATSDNGPWFQGSPGGLRGRKHGVFDGGLRVPLIAHRPGWIRAGTVVDEPVMGIDLLPTVLEVAGLPRPGDRILDGRSLAGVLAGGPPPRREGLFFHQLGVARAVRSGRFKYHDRHRVFYGNPMHWAWGPMIQRGPWLFDLELDPGESYDASSKHPREAERLARRLAEWQAHLESNPRGWNPG